MDKKTRQNLKKYFSKGFFFSITLTLIGLFCAGCQQSLNPPLLETGLVGQLVSFPNTKISTLRTTDGKKTTTQTDENGAFKFRLEPGIYSLILEDDHFLERENLLEKNLVVSEGVLTTILNLRMIPIPIVSNVTNTTRLAGFTVSFKTDIPAQGFLEYGSDATYGLFTPIPLDAVTDHAILLDGLTSGSTVHFRIIARRRNLPAAQFTSENFKVTLP